MVQSKMRDGKMKLDIGNCSFMSAMIYSQINIYYSINFICSFDFWGYFRFLFLSDGGKVPIIECRKHGRIEFLIIFSSNQVSFIYAQEKWHGHNHIC